MSLLNVRRAVARSRQLKVGIASISLACGGGTDATKPPSQPQTAAVATVIVSGGTVVGVSQTIQLTATPRDGSGNQLNDRTINWTTSSLAVATVSSTGLVTGLVAGSATITATVEGKTGTASVAVTDVVVPGAVATVSVSGGNAVGVSQTIQLTANPRDGFGNQLNDRPINWTTSSPTVATVSGTGRVTGLAAGSATITATVEGKTGTALVAVTDVAVASVSIGRTSVTVASHQLLSLNATARDESGIVIPGTPNWTTSDPAIVAIEADGSLEGLSAGMATVTAWANGKSASAQVTVIAFASIAAGSRDICALTFEGAMYCAGMRFTDRARPVWPTVRWSQIDEAGENEGLPVAHLCGVTIGGEVMCWGTNSSGELGVGDTADRNTPTLVSIPERVTQVSTGAYHTCALTTGGSIYCWGKNSFGQLGNGNSVDALEPVRTATPEKFVQVSTGFQQTCALSIQGRVLCWGRNVLGELGRGNWADGVPFPFPAAVVSSSQFKSVSLKGSHSCALSTVGQAYCWGANTVFELGQVTTELCSGDHPCGTIPRPVSGGMTFETVASSGFGGCGVTESGSVRCWGLDIQSALGVNGSVPTCPVEGAARGCTSAPLQGPAGFKTLSGSERNYCGIRANGGAYCWGGNSRGQLGVPEITESAIPRVFAIDPAVVLR